MFDPTHRFATLVLAAGGLVLLAAIGIGQRMGDRVLGQATEHTMPSVAVVTPEPYASSGPYGPDWKRSETLSAASDPHFPDPRVPPQPLPTRPTPAPTPATSPTPTINPNVPIWRQKPLPTATPYEPTAQPSESPSASASPSAESSP